LHVQDAEGINDGSYPVMDNSFNKLTEVMLLAGQDLLWSLRWLLGAFCTQ